MKRIVIVALFLLLLEISLFACANETAHDMGEEISDDETEISSESELPDMELALSELYIKISSGETFIVFQLYDTEAAKEFYEQLSLQGSVAVFDDTQWGFSLEKELCIKSEETYHNGKEGELIYDKIGKNMQVLYEDSDSDNEIYRLGICVSGMDRLEGLSQQIKIEPYINDENWNQTMYIKIGDTTLTATLEDNSSARALTKILPITIEMSDYGNFEKVGNLGTDLPRNDEYLVTTAGDLILYQGKQFVIYYDSNTWNLTRLGKINDVSPEELRNLLGKGNITVTLSFTP